MWSYIGPLLRHGLTILGGALVANGLTDEATAQTIVGGIVAAGGIVWSIIEKRVFGKA